MGLLIMVTIASVTGDVVAKSLETEPLIEIAKRYQLPVPPNEARLVLAHTESWRGLGNRSTGHAPGIYSPAFLLKEEPTGNIHILRGAERETLKTLYNGDALWLPFSTVEVMPQLGGHVSEFSRLSAFVCAVQTAARGDADTAQTIWLRFSAAKWWSDGRVDEDVSSQLQDQHVLLGRCIFDHLRNSLLKTGTDRNDVHDRMSALLKEFPQLNDDWRRELFEDLTATVNAPPPKVGSVEALLLDWASSPSTMRRIWKVNDEHTHAADAPAREIFLRGLGAVPELIALLNDRRITAHHRAAFMRAPARIKRVGDLARHFIREVAGDPTSFPRYGGDTEAILAWWEKARTLDESFALLQSVFVRDGEKITGVNEGPVHIVATKFAEKLPALCDEFTAFATPDAQPYVLAEALAKSNLPKERRVQVLSQFAERGSLEHKRCVLQNLAELDQHVCAALLLPILDELPRNASGPYLNCPEAGFTRVVVQLEDDNVWRAYLDAAKHSSIGLRMEMINPLNYCYIGKKNFDRRLAFLSAFLDDEAVRDMSGGQGQFQGPCAGFTIHRLAVRDFAAMKLASLLDMKETPDEFWTNAQWAELRRKVKKRLADQKLPVL